MNEYTPSPEISDVTSHSCHVPISASPPVASGVEPGTGASPTAADSVQVNYKGSLIDGTVFDSSYERGQPATFPLAGVIPGFREGIQKMKVGGKYKLYIPPAQGYGERGAGKDIPPNATLVFEIELLDVNPPAAPPTGAAEGGGQGQGGGH